jgi:hypothetical protein
LKLYFEEINLVVVSNSRGRGEDLSQWSSYSRKRTEGIATKTAAQDKIHED